MNIIVQPKAIRIKEYFLTFKRKVLYYASDILKNVLMILLLIG